MKDIKYIIKRVIIGVAIVLVLSCINGCKVKALAPNVSGLELVKNFYIDYSSSSCNIVESYDSPGRDRSYGLYYQASNDRYYFAFASDDNGSANTTSYYLEHASRVPYISVLCYNNNSLRFNFTASPVFYDATDFINGSSIFPGAGYVKQNGYNAYASITYANAFTVNGNYSHSDTTATYTVSFNSDFNQDLALVNANTNRKLLYTNYNARDLTTNNIFFNRNVDWNPADPIVSTPTFVSWNYEKIVNNNILLGYNFEPEFSTFDITNYTYQYKIGNDSNTWLSLTENRQSIDVRGNTIIYVRVKDLQNNIIDSATFTVSGVGTFSNSQNIEYDIKFSGEYRTRDDLQINESGGSAIIEEYQIYTDFIPNSSILKYQYQWVPIGGTLDSNSWVDINLEPTDYGDFTYVVNLNGTFYARILDSENNLKYSATFTVNTIGKLAIDSGNDKITDKFMSIATRLNIGGPISTIIEIPLKVINIISTGLAGGLTCSDYQLGNLMGTNLVIPCVNIKSHLGNNLYATIDIILACVILYNIYKMIMSMYTSFIFMQNNPIQELGDRGD